MRLHLLLTYPWPGNVRELDNLLQRALILVNGPVIREEHIQFELANDGGAAEPQQRAKAAPAGAHLAGVNGRAVNGAANSGAVVDSMAIVNSMASATVNSLASSLDQAERDPHSRCTALGSGKPARGGRAAGNQPAHAALQARPVARSRH